MLCQKCQKNDANVHVMQSINGVVIEQYLCSECVNITQNTFSEFSKKMFSNMFSNNLFEHELFPQSALNKSYPNFDGLLTRQYDEYVLPEISKNSGEEDMGYAKKILALKKDLKHAIKKEDFEKAAKLRDRIKELER